MIGDTARGSRRGRAARRSARRPTASRTRPAPPAAAARPAARSSSSASTSRSILLRVDVDGDHVTVADQAERAARRALGGHLGDHEAAVDQAGHLPVGDHRDRCGQPGPVDGEHQRRRQPHAGGAAQPEPGEHHDVAGREPPGLAPPRRPPPGSARPWPARGTTSGASSATVRFSTAPSGASEPAHHHDRRVRGERRVQRPDHVLVHGDGRDRLAERDPGDGHRGQVEQRRELLQQAERAARRVELGDLGVAVGLDVGQQRHLRRQVLEQPVDVRRRTRPRRRWPAGA